MNEIAKHRVGKMLQKTPIIDEWQMAPVLWDAVRTAVDEHSEEGLFILTGSTTIDHTMIMHSVAR